MFRYRFNVVPALLLNKYQVNYWGLGHSILINSQRIFLVGLAVIGSYATSSLAQRLTQSCHIHFSKNSFHPLHFSSVASANFKISLCHNINSTMSAVDMFRAAPPIARYTSSIIKCLRCADADTVQDVGCDDFCPFNRRVHKHCVYLLGDLPCTLFLKTSATTVEAFDSVLDHWSRSRNHFRYLLLYEQIWLSTLEHGANLG
jgi:hypothetical protein